jgi:hypothetical protein
MLIYYICYLKLSTQRVKRLMLSLIEVLLGPLNYSRNVYTAALCVRSIKPYARQ